LFLFFLLFFRGGVGGGGGGGGGGVAFSVLLNLPLAILRFCTVLWAAPPGLYPFCMFAFIVFSGNRDYAMHRCKQTVYHTYYTPKVQVFQYYHENQF